MTWTLGLMSIAGLLAIAAVVLSVFGDRAWTRDTRALKAGLEAARLDGPGKRGSPHARYDVSELDSLPAPVQRYFRAVLRDGQPIVSAVTIDLAGTFNLSLTGERWRLFTSLQRVVKRLPGFVWDARIALLPGLTVRVVDSYVAGAGWLRAAMQGVVTMAELRGEGEIARGEFMRWFAEAPWYPTALLPSQGVRWQAVDARSANATIVDGPIGLTLLFRFDDAGLIGSLRAEARGALVGGTMVMAPWEGSWSNYAVRDGLLVPSTGEVAWMRPDGRRPYFAGTVTAIAFEFTA